MGSRISGSVTRLARPLTRNVSSNPGTMNNRPTLGLATMFAKLSKRLLPGRSGIAERVLIEDLDEPHRVAARTDVGPPFPVLRADADEGRAPDEGLRMFVEEALALVDRQGSLCVEETSERFLARHHEFRFDLVRQLLPHIAPRPMRYVPHTTLDTSPDQGVGVSRGGGPRTVRRGQLPTPRSLVFTRP